MSKISRKKNKSKRKLRFLALAIVVFFIGAGAYFLVTTVGESKRIEQSLNDRFGWANQYTPPVDGSIHPQQVEGFIRVRQAVQTSCADYQGILDDIIGLEALETNPDMSAGEKASEGIGSFKSMFSAAPKMLAFMDARNASLLAEEMGLGEYIYIYLAAYGEQLANEPESRYSGMEEAYISPRARSEFILILGNQLAALEGAGQDNSPAALSNELRREIAALEDGSHASPWPNGPPGPTRNSLATYRKQLSDLYCPGIVKIELLQKNRGLKFEG